MISRKLENPLRFYKQACLKRPPIFLLTITDSQIMERERMSENKQICMALEVDGTEGKGGDWWTVAAMWVGVRVSLSIFVDAYSCLFIRKISFYTIGMWQRFIIHFLKYTAHLGFTTVHKMGQSNMLSSSILQVRWFIVYSVDYLLQRIYKEYQTQG